MAVDTSGTWICVGDIRFDKADRQIVTFEHGTEFPMDLVHSETVAKLSNSAKAYGIDPTADDPKNIAAMAPYLQAAEAQFEREVGELIETKSIMRPGDVLPSGTLAAQLAQKEAELELLRQQLAEQGVAPSLLPGAPKRGKAQPVAAPEDGASSAE